MSSAVPGNSLEPVNFFVIQYWILGIKVDKNNAEITDITIHAQEFTAKLKEKVAEILRESGMEELIKE